MRRRVSFTAKLQEALAQRRSALGLSPAFTTARAEA